MAQDSKDWIQQHAQTEGLKLGNKHLRFVERGLLATKVILLLYLAVGGNEAAQARIPFVLTALEVIVAQVEKRLEASEEERQEKPPVKGE